MATTFKTFLNNDKTTTRTLLHEAIPITGSIVSGTYDTSAGVSKNIKDYSHGMFQSTFDYPYLSSSANHIFDITVGYSPNSPISSSTATQNAKKINIYNSMAQVLAGNDITGSIREFDKDGDYVAGGAKIREAFILNFTRLLSKDEIQKGSFELKLGLSGTTGGNRFGAGGNFSNHFVMTITDASGSNKYYTNSPAGEYGILFATASATSGDGSQLLGMPDRHPCGLLYYQAGVAVISGSVFSSNTDGGILNPAMYESTIVVAPNSFEQQNPGLSTTNAGTVTFEQALTGNTIQAMSDAIRNRIQNVQFNNTTELNSSIYFCRVGHNEFNYSSNPTYTSNSKIRVKRDSTDTPVTYFTTVGLYSADNELLAVAKLSEPLKKDPTNEMTIRVRLDY